MKLNNESLKNKGFWEKACIALPRFDREKMIAATKAAPKWVHFGAGNIFRAFPATIMQKLLEQGVETTGIVAVKNYDEKTNKTFTACDNLTILVTLKSDGSTDKQVIASIASSVQMDNEFEKLKTIFTAPSLQMASFTITEKGYSLKDRDGNLFPDVAQDLKKGLSSPKSYLGRIACLLHERFKNGALPIAMASMDNCSHNGDILFAAMETIVKGWVENGVWRGLFKLYPR